MPFTSADVAKIEAAIASGEKSVRFSDGRQVDYRDVGDLMRALAAARSDVAAASNPGAPRSRTARLIFRRD